MAAARGRDPGEALRESPPVENLEQQSSALDRRWAMTGWTIAWAIRNPSIQHPIFQNHTTTCDVPIEWPGFPAGTRFDPTDIELIKHLEEKIGIANSMPHPFINAFIPTIEEPEGICSKHPENLPGIRMDGSKHYFFHKIPDATGGRKRRKINKESDYWWHQTGHAQDIRHDDGKGGIRGWKKIFVLKKARINADWTIHQYHIGEDPKEGELVVSKIFYSRLRPKCSSPPVPDDHILQDYQDEAEMGAQNNVADALQACSPSMDAKETVKRYLALIAVPTIDHANLPVEEQPPELSAWNWQHAGISVADEYVAVPNEQEPMQQVQHEEAAAQDPAGPVVPLDWWSSSMDVLPVRGPSSPADPDWHLPLTGTDDLGSSQRKVQLGSREGLESLLDYY